jgi:hypothetical protein
MGRRARREHPPSLVNRSKLSQVSSALLQVIPDDLRQLVRAVARLRFEPTDKPFMQLGALTLEEGTVGRVLNESVIESDGLLVHEGGRVVSHELPAAELVERCSNHRLQLSRRHRHHRTLVKDETDDRALLQYGAVLHGKLLEASGHERCDRGGHCDVS